MIVKRALSVIFLLIVIGIMFIDYFSMFLTSELILPKFVDLICILLPIVLLFLAIWSVFKLFNINKIAKKCITIISFVVMLLPLLYFSSNIVKNYQNSFFEKNRWIQKPDERVYMVDNMLYKNKLKGMTRDEVKLLLGEPTDTEYFKAEDNIVYYLGPERGFIRIDSEWLVIGFNNKGEVEGYTITTD